MAMTLRVSQGAVQCLVSLRFTFRSTSGSFCGNPQEQSQPQAMTPIFRYYPAFHPIHLISGLFTYPIKPYQAPITVSQ